jgi:hypothetical protein
MMFNATFNNISAVLLVQEPGGPRENPVILVIEIGLLSLKEGDRHGRDRMVIEFTTTYAICPYHH